MHIYFAARYSRRLEMRGYAQELENLGHSIASQWIDTGDNQQDDHDFELSERCGFAKQDWDDLRTANCMICFTEAPKTASRGGRHVEYGMALAYSKRIIVVGHRETVFHCLPTVEFFETWDQALKAL